MTPRAAESTRNEITRETAERHEQRLQGVMNLLAANRGEVHFRLVSRIRLHMESMVPRYSEPELEIYDHRGRARATITVERKEFRVALMLTGGVVHVKEARQAALLAGTP
ncbi:hypothetical protein [Nonomuraea typhae]|uniref:hypothetical protein n=1 Tax=Nonomuraea typhae TaxID=2603600 RepID=UPI0012FBCA7F|nr:hypothetical protein [Nonomuraea typhae]